MAMTSESGTFRSRGFACAAVGDERATAGYIGKASRWRGLRYCRGQSKTPAGSLRYGDVSRIHTQGQFFRLAFFGFSST